MSFAITILRQKREEKDEEAEDELDSYIIDSLTSHTRDPEADEKKLEMTAQLQDQALMAVLRPEQQEELQHRQMGLARCATEADFESKMQEVTAWVESVLTHDQKEEIEKKMAVMLEDYELRNAREQYDSAKALVTQHVLNADQRRLMAQAQQEAALLQEQGQTDRVREVLAL